MHHPLRRFSRSPALPLTFTLTVLLPLLLGEGGCSVLRRGRDRTAARTELPSGSPGSIGKQANAQGLTAEARFTPDPVKLGETRQIDVTLVVRNVTKRRLASLKFVTSQRLEILLREPGSGKVLSQWSQDRTFDPNGGYLLINPGERLEFNQSITTRELKAGNTYNLEAYLVGYDRELRATRVIIPQP